MPREELVRVDTPQLTPEDRDRHPSSASNALLWFAVLGGPAAWTIDELAAFFVHQSWCGAATTHREIAFGGLYPILIVIGIAMAAGAALAGFIAWRALRDLGIDTGLGETSYDRRRFMAHAGMLMSMLFLFGILLRWIAVFFVNAHVCNMGS